MKDTVTMLVEALKGLEEAYCRSSEPLTREERHQDRLRLIAARKALSAAKGGGWISESERKPLESDGEVFVRFTDGSIGTAWATYWHGASNEFAQWTHPDPDEDRQIAFWMLPPPPKD